MRRRSLPIVLAAAVCLAASSFRPASAASVTVRNDTGSAGFATITNLDGVNFRLDFLQPGAQMLNSINAGIVNLPTPAWFSNSVTFKVTSGAGTHNIGLLSDIGNKYFDPTGGNTHLTYDLRMGESTQLQGSLTLDGRILSAPQPFLTLGSAPNQTVYDFSDMPGGAFQLVMTSPTFTNATSFLDLFMSTNIGATASGSMSFSQTAIPEPASMALLGIGLSGLLFHHRRMAKRKLAAQPATPAAAWVYSRPQRPA